MKTISKKEIINFLELQNFDSDSIGAVIQVLLKHDLHKTLINQSCDNFKHISSCGDDSVILSSEKPIGYCNRSGGYVFPSDVNEYDGVSPNLDENVDLSEFTLPIKEEEENPEKFNWNYINHLKNN